MEPVTFKRLLDINDNYEISTILIPKIQRAYAQGREDVRTSKTRARFLGSIYDKINEGKPLTLDFIYGHVNKNCLIPLDGQQRLTTLWLFHWYAAKKKGVMTNVLGKFTYNTRYSARDFIKRMETYTPEWEGRLSDEIRNEGWFPLDWCNDPTVRGMLVMLNAIDELFSGIENLWEKLDLINFYFLPLEELNLTDEVYIKMNSRGKPLTDFEHFKAEFLKEIKNIKGEDEQTSAEMLSKRIGRKIDIQWTDLLWCFRGEDNLIDDQFLRLFRIVCHLITYRDDRSYNEEISKLDDFQLIKEFFTGEDALRNVVYLERFFDSWVEINDSVDKGDFRCGIEAFFNNYLSHQHEAGKSIPLGTDIDIFNVMASSYPNLRRPNVLQCLTTFYAFLVYIQNRDKVSEADFRRRLRIILNLQKNSGNEIVDTPKGDAGNRMPAVLRHVEQIVREGRIDRNVEVTGKERPTFNVTQLTEEAEKLVFTESNPENAEPLFILEDHWLLNGRTFIVGYQNTQLYRKFAELFENCSRDAIDCALLASGDYSQRLSNQIIQLGSGNDEKPGDDAWYNLSHPTEKAGNADATAMILRSLLGRIDNFSDAALYEIVSGYEKECQENFRFDWRYYYIHYGKFRAHRYGKYTLYVDSPYELVALYAPKYESTKAYQCFLAELAGEYMDWADDIRKLAYKEGCLICRNDRFVYTDRNGEDVISELLIPQEDGIDIVDRIAYFRSHPL